jgi:hypothetical protein
MAARLKLISSVSRLSDLLAIDDGYNGMLYILKTSLLSFFVAFFVVLFALYLVVSISNFITNK